MGRRCCIAGCTSTSRLPEHHGVTYHSFPLDKVTRSIWIRNTRISADRQITKSVLVCSRHFRRADFQPQRSGKYLLKQRVFPTVFPWGKIDPTQVETDMEDMKNTSATNYIRAPALPNNAASNAAAAAAAAEDVTKATVEATVAQILAETAELNAASGVKGSSSSKLDTTLEASANERAAVTNSPVGVKFEPVTTFHPGARLEAQDFDGIWHSARVVEVDNDDREVLIKFERSGKNKSAIAGTEEWIPMNSNRLRQKVSTKPVPVFELEEKCLARWTGPRKFPGTVKKILGNATYEVLFDDGYVKNVRAIHMSKITIAAEPEPAVAVTTTTTPAVPVVIAAKAAEETSITEVEVTAGAVPTLTTPVATTSSTPLKTHKKESGSSKKRTAAGQRKDWPLLDMSKLDLTSLNLPEIPRDGEWTCHWVNDQPIGREGFLIVGEHHKPTVIVDDWRLPPGWVKHMYQRSNVLGKWDVILVTPSNKRFRSKSDLKTHLEEQGQVYNPDIYDFSIHRRRAKDINCYVFTSDYTPPQPVKQKHETSISVPSSAAIDATPTVLPTGTSQYLETPVATPVPPMELMTPTEATSPLTTKNIVAISTPLRELDTATAAAAESSLISTIAGAISSPAASTTADAEPAIEDGYAYIGGLKVQIIDNLFRCPQQGCSKNFRKENHLQIHVKHYHQDLIKLLGECPKMLELAEKRTHTIKPDQNEPTPKNQIPNQQFFAKLHQQDMQQTRSHRKGLTTTTTGAIPNTSTAAAMGAAGVLSTMLDGVDIKAEADSKNELLESLNTTAGTDISVLGNTATSSSTTNIFNQTLGSTTIDNSLLNISGIPIKRSRFSPRKSASGSRKSNRQRTTRRYLTAAQATGVAGVGAGASSAGLSTTADSSFGVSEFEETRHSFNATPDTKMLLDSKRRKPSAAPATPLSGLDSPVTADSGSSSFQPLLAPSSNEADAVAAQQAQYIKENGELIKIVRMRQEEIINCLCSYGEEDGLMIQCELCLCWQHGVCNGIDKESDVPDKYVCYICRNPQRARDSLRFKHDQDWLYEGKLPVANYHMANPALQKRFDFLKKSHTITGNLVELKHFARSLRVKINIANNRVHPKLYLWAKKWDEDPQQQQQLLMQQQQQANALNIKAEDGIKQEGDVEMKLLDASATTTTLGGGCMSSPSKRIKSEPTTPARPMPNIPQPEAPIDPVECQHRLLEHIKVQQNLVMTRLAKIEAEIDVLEQHDDLPDLKEADFSTTKEMLSSFIRELDVMKQIAKLNSLENTKNVQQGTAIK